MDIEHRINKINEQLTQLLEGDVISFLDYKRKKQSDKFLKDNEQELNKLLNNKIFVTIDNVDVIWAEGRIDGVNSFKDGEKLSYEEFQKRAYEYDYVLRNRIGVDKVKITIYFSMEQNGEIEQDRYNTMIYIGDDKDLKFNDVNLARILLRAGKDYTEGKEVIIKNAIYPEDMNFNNLAYGKEEPEESLEKETVSTNIKDYSNNGTKTPEDVQVGDILTRTWGYSMILVDFYKVIDRKSKSIKLAKLETKNVSGDGWSGQCVPTDKTVSDTDVDGKLFRIGYKYNKDAVCRVNDHSCEYWNGKPKTFDHLD